MNKEYELSVAKKIQDENIQCEIIFNEESPFTLYKSNDIAVYLGLKKIRNSTCNFSDKEKVIRSSVTNGGIQLTIFLKIFGKKRLLAKSRKQKVMDFANIIGLEAHSFVIPSVEATTLKCITEAFSGEDMKEQFGIKNYRIDMYFPDYKLAIECDDSGHNKVKDEERMQEIMESLGCTFIRYEPYSKSFCIFKVINDIYTHIANYKKRTFIRRHKK